MPACIIKEDKLDTVAGRGCRYVSTRTTNNFCLEQDNFWWLVTVPNADFENNIVHTTAHILNIILLFSGK